MGVRRENGRLLILTDIDDEKSLTPITFELLGAARKLAKKNGAILCAAVLGHEVRTLAQEMARFADEVYCVDEISLATFQADLYADALEQLCRSVTPEIFLAGHTLGNLELAPKLAYRMGARLITDCVSLNVDEKSGDLILTKPVFGENAFANFRSTEKPYMATIRPNAVEPVDQALVGGKIIDFNPVIDCSRTRTVLVEVVRSENIRLDRAGAVVAGGRGIKRIEDLKHLEDLAEALREHFDAVEVGASRPLVDAGWLPPFRQVGLTGAKIKPELYMAIGISGSLQHLSGVFGAKKIVAINTDPDASIFNYADIGVVGDYESVLPPLVSRLRELACESSRYSFV
jgi:electron transfer flavoprotein alpha subunit